jgi:NADH-ubiquinone oxidoreductase chain 5
MGLLYNQIPITTTCISVANIALCGFPFIAGFYSKDLIIEIATYSAINSLIIIIIIISIGLTSFYSIRFSSHLIISPISSTPWIILNEEENINYPIINLSLIATVTGSILSWSIPVSGSVTFIPLILKLRPLIIISTGLLIGFYISSLNHRLFSIQNNIKHYAVCLIWFIVPLSTQFIIKFPIYVAHINLKSIDQGWIELPQLIHHSISVTNFQITFNYPKQASQLTLITSIRIILFLIITTIYSNNLHKIFHWRWKNEQSLNTCM